MDGHDPTTSRRWWKLYRQERAKHGEPKDVLSSAQIVRAAREATRRYRAGDGA